MISTLTAAPHASHDANPGSCACRYRLCRPEAVAEWQAYHAIRQSVLFESGGRAPQHPDTDEMRDGHFPLLLWADDQPIGTIRVDRLESGLAALRLVAIDQVCQGRGHGLRLLREAETFARAIGCRTAVVYSTQEAAGFYARAGYTEDSWDDCCVGGIVQMTRTLG